MKTDFLEIKWTWIKLEFSECHWVVMPQTK